MKKVYTRFGIEETYSNGITTTKAYNLKKAEDFYYILVGLDLMDLKCFVNDMEINIKKQKESLLNKDPHALQFLLSNDYNHAHRIDVRYPYLLRNSLFISIYSLLEDALVKLCNFYKQQKSVQTDINYYNGAIIDRAKKFIKDEMDLSIPQKQWKQITQYRQIRNSIVHSNGYIFKNDNASKVISSINVLKDSGIGLKNQSVIELNKNACLNFIAVVETLLLNICKSLQFLDNMT